MLDSQRFFSISAIALLIIVALVSLSCGGSSSTPTGFSSAQAQAISQELSIATSSALAAGLAQPGGSASRPPSLARILQSIPQTQSSGCTFSDNGESCDIPITYTGNCPAGGTITVTGDLIYTLDNSGNGSDSSSLVLTPTNCSVSNITVNGDPNVAVTSNLSFQDFALSYPTTFSETGGISYGPNPSGSCSLSVKFTATSATSCTITGSICGQSVSGSC